MLPRLGLHSSLRSGVCLSKISRSLSTSSGPIRKAFIMSVNKGCEEEYARRHQPIWEELQQVLKSHGSHNYSIFLDKQTNQLFGCVEVESEVNNFSKFSSKVHLNDWFQKALLMLCNRKDGRPLLKQMFVRGTGSVFCLRVFSIPYLHSDSPSPKNHNGIKMVEVYEWYYAFKRGWESHCARDWWSFPSKVMSNCWASFKMDDDAATSKQKANRLGRAPANISCCWLWCDLVQSPTPRPLLFMLL